MTKPSLIARCTLSEQCLPDAPYRAMLAALHKDMLDEIDRLKAAQPAPVQEPVAIDTLPRACNLAGVDYQTYLKIKAYMPATPPAQPAVPDAFGTREGEHPQYIQGWNDCRAEMLKGMKP
jgi:hypothetical protein